MNIKKILEGYDLKNLTIGVLGGHSALDVCNGAKLYGFNTVAVCQEGRDKTYSKYFKTRGEGKGCIDNVIMVPKFGDVVTKEVQEQLRALNTIFVHNRYFWVYCDFEKVEKEFEVPIYGSRELVKLEERDHPNNQYMLLDKAGIRIPKILRAGGEKLSEDELGERLDRHFVRSNGGPLIVKVNEATRSYERAFFIITKAADYFALGNEKIRSGKILEEDLENAVIEEYVVGAHINLNFFYSPLTEELEFMGTDTRRQTNLDGFLRLDAETQRELLGAGYSPSMIENGHYAVTMKESLLEKAFDLGEKFVEVLKKEVSPGMIGPFALQGAVVAEEGREEFVIFDVSMRIPGSPGTKFTPYSGYLYGESMSYGERIAMEIADAVEHGGMEKLLT